MTVKLPVCSKCGSHNIAWDASAVWNPETNKMELASTHDCATCQDCDNEMNSGADFVEFKTDPKAALSGIVEALTDAIEELDQWACGAPELSPEEKKRHNEYTTALLVAEQALRAMP